LAAQGLSTIAPEQGLQVLEQVLGQALAQVGVLPFDLSAFRQQLSSGKPPLLGSCKPQEEAEQASAQRHELYNDWRRLP